MLIKSYYSSLFKKRKPTRFIGHRKLRSLRLLQIFWALQFTFLIVGVHWYLFSEAFYIVNVLVASLLLFFSRYYARRGDNEKSAAILLLVVTALLTAQVWNYNGLGDEALFAFPIVLIFAIVFGSQRLFLVLLLYITIMFVLLAVATEEGWRVDYPNSSSYDTAIILVVILLIGAYSVWLLSSDSQLFLARLSTENEKVKQSEEKIRNLVHHDALTGLPNRILLRDRFEQAVKNGLRNKKLVGLIFMDIDNFKHINDSLGHQVGDDYLVEIASRLLDVVRESDTVSRQGGDEFLILLQSVASDADLINVAEKILAAIAEPVSIKGHKLVTTCSLGIATVPNDGTDFDILCQKADVSMYRSKEQGKNSFFFYNEAIHANVLENLAIIGEMKNALKLEQFELYLQPKVDLKDNRLVGAECLIRWKHPFRQISPAQFIPLAEKSGLIIEIGSWVIHQACRTASLLNKKLGSSIVLSVNVSPVQFSRHDFVNLFLQSIEETGISAQQLEIEITENLLVDDAKSIFQALKILKSKGVQISIDDFGTGYSNLSYLKSLDIDVIKIDQSFVKGIVDSDEDKAIVNAVVQMARSLGIESIAEGIEDAHIAEQLSMMGCDMGQGYFWAKPMPLDDFLSRYQ